MNKNIEVDKYLSKVPEEYRQVLAELRENILELLPEGMEIIYYHMPTYKIQGKPILTFAAFKNHCSLVTMKAHVVQKLKKELTGYVVSGTTIHFSAENPISKDILSKIIKERLSDIKN